MCTPVTALHAAATILYKRITTSQQAILTGSNRGIGLRTATHMAEMQAKTILAVRDTAKGEAAKQCIIDELQQKRVLIDPDNIEVLWITV
jgi:NAD(P)-dependent dehydrogenase (short-subunit alcohol dehydrogenase family)